MSTSVPPELLREVIREVVREVIREVVAEEIAAAALASRPGSVSTPATPRRTVDAGARRPAPTAAAVAATTLHRGALTERHVRAVGKDGTITIGTAVVITPLARERARAMGVEIIRIEG